MLLVNKFWSFFSFFLFGGEGASDHVFRSAMMSKVYSVPGLRALLPFVSQPSTMGRRRRRATHREAS